MKKLYFKPSHPIVSMLESRSDILSLLQVVGNVECRWLNVEDESHDLMVVESTDQYMKLVDQLIPYSGDNRHPFLCVKIWGNCHISKYASPGLERLHLCGAYYFLDCRVTAEHDLLAPCLFLTRLSFDSLLIGKSVLTTLDNSMKRGKLPVLARLGLTYCTGLEGQLSVLFRNQWRSLTHLDLSDTDLQTSDIKYLASCENMNCLKLHSIIRTDKHLNSLTTSVALAGLQKLDISNSLGITGKLSVLLRHGFPSLNTLILRYSWLNPKDLCSLAQANAEGRLPKLTQLDISNNYKLVGHLQSLFEYDQKWEHLIKLTMKQNKMTNKDCQTLLSKVQSGCLSSLEELEFSVHHVDGIGKVKWLNLKQLIVACPKSSSTKTLEQIAKGVELGMFPKLVKLNRYDEIILVRSYSVDEEYHSELLKKTDELWRDVRSGNVTRDEVVEFLVDYLVNTRFMARREEDALYHSMYHSVVEAMEASQTHRWDALFVEFCSKYLGANEPSIDILMGLENFLDGVEKKSWRNNNQKLPDIKERLRKCGVQVYRTIEW